MLYMNQQMDFSASPPVSWPWAVVLAVCVVGSLSTCATEAAPLILQLDSTALMGHRLVIAIEPLLNGIMPMSTKANTSAAILINTTADAINGSIIYFESNSDEVPVTPDGPEMLSADDINVEHPSTSTPTTVVVTEEDLQIAVEVNPELLPRSRQLSNQEQYMSSYTSINSVQPEEENTKNALGFGEIPSPRTLPRDKEDNVDKFLITFPNRCPDGWILEHGQCRHPFKSFKDIAKPMTRSKLSKHALDLGEVPSLLSRTRNKEDVDNFLITFPNRCPDGWKVEHGQCRRPFNSFNKIAKPRRKTKPKRKIKMMQ